jgi:hypothetical protein
MGPRGPEVGASTSPASLGRSSPSTDAESTMDDTAATPGPVGATHPSDAYARPGDSRRRRRARHPRRRRILRDDEQRRSRILAAISPGPPATQALAVRRPGAHPARSSTCSQ